MRARLGVTARLGEESGQSMTELALVLPVLLLVVLGGLQLGAVFLQSQQLSSAVSEGARRAIVSSQKPNRDAVPAIVIN